MKKTEDPKSLQLSAMEEESTTGELDQVRARAKGQTDGDGDWWEGRLEAPAHQWAANGVAEANSRDVGVANRWCEAKIRIMDVAASSNGPESTKIGATADTVVTWSPAPLPSRKRRPRFGAVREERKGQVSAKNPAIRKSG